MSAANPGIAAKDTKEETKAEREERVMREFLKGTTSIGFKIADESVEEIHVTFSDELKHTIEKAEKLKELSSSPVVSLPEQEQEPPKKKVKQGESILSPICTVRIDSTNKTDNNTTSENDNYRINNANEPSENSSDTAIKTDDAPLEMDVSIAPQANSTSDEVTVKEETREVSVKIE